MTAGRVRKAKARKPKGMRTRNPQAYRLQSAIRFFETWEDRRLIEKAGNLTGRLLAINKVLGDREKPILSKSVMENLLTLYTQLTPQERLEPYNRGARGQAQGEDRGPSQQDEDRLRSDDSQGQ